MSSSEFQEFVLAANQYPSLKGIQQSGASEGGLSLPLNPDLQIDDPHKILDVCNVRELRFCQKKDELELYYKGGVISWTNQEMDDLWELAKQFEKSHNGFLVSLPIECVETKPFAVDDA